MKKLNVNISFLHATDGAMLQLVGSFCGMDAMNAKDSLLSADILACREVTIDLTTVGKADLTGINVLAMAYRQISRLGIKVQILTRQGSPLDQWLGLTKFDQVLPVQYSLAA